jgi:hypothetical protein
VAVRPCILPEGVEYWVFTSIIHHYRWHCLVYHNGSAMKYVLLIISLAEIPQTNMSHSMIPAQRAVMSW